ncbi:thiamine kinase-like enzyme [Peribacillus huizhouensis]|uniref:Thiamine kinase-like enzyme n=1 Tax=Peribacillus huizhouensis TaxID=1501239 RepID=A0ABR6CMK7_9BACI|nr:thiamine kinase-like enzyme [Peribacillus huizhouensis]
MRKLKVNQLEHLLGQEWDIFPAGGATGEAFIAVNKNEKLFLKRNSSPFLAVLSAEGVVPKLIWTRRLENGDTITAQRFIDGKELTHEEMNEEKVAHLLRKIHRSKPLLSMLKRLGKTPLLPDIMLENIASNLDLELQNISPIQQTLYFLQENLSLIECDDKVVCHCDVNHNNWMITKENKLYLIDWDGAMIADPAIDLGILLNSYIPREQWGPWLSRYGVDLEPGLLLRMKWHVLAQLLISIQWHKRKNRLKEMDILLKNLEAILV